MQCIAGAMTTGAAASGVRTWLVALAPTWLTPARRRFVSRALVVVGVLAGGLIGPSPG
jgi:hypothetical protein